MRWDIEMGDIEAIVRGLSIQVALLTIRSDTAMALLMLAAIKRNERPELSILQSNMVGALLIAQYVIVNANKVVELSALGEQLYQELSHIEGGQSSAS